MAELDALQAPAAATEPVQQTQGPDLHRDLAHLAFTFLKTFQYLQLHECQPTMLHMADLDHMLPGRPQRFRGKGSA